VPQAFQEGEGAGAVVGHAVLQDQIREVAVAEQAGLFAAQLEDAADQRAVVEIATGCAGRVSAVEQLADGAVVEIHQQRGEVGACKVNRHPSTPFRAALWRAAATALGGSPASLSSRSRTSSNALVESRTFSEKRVVTALSSTSISAGEPCRPDPDRRRGVENRRASLVRTGGRAPSNCRAFPVAA